MIGLLAPRPSLGDTFRIEIDYMADATHSHKPSQLVIDAVKKMFECQGHMLVVEVSDSLEHFDALRRDPNDCQGTLFTYWGGQDTFFGILMNHFDHRVDGNWHYCIFAHQFEGGDCTPVENSGVAQNPGWNLIVSLGTFSGNIGTEFEQAATLAHEFGHNLGLEHCGSPGTCLFANDGVPILPSTMTYDYQLSGIRNAMLSWGLTFDEARFRNIDYSHGRMCPVFEPSLDENVGTVMLPVDWDCDGTLESSVGQNLDTDGGHWCGTFDLPSQLTDYDEWSVIADPTTPYGVKIPVAKEAICITAEEHERNLMRLRERGIEPLVDLEVEDCSQGKLVFLSVSGSDTGAGDCADPFKNVAWAHSHSPGNSVFVLRPGTYDETGQVILNVRGKYFSNLGSAVIR